MRADVFTKALLSLIAFLLGAIALRPLLDPPASRAQSLEPYELYIEPGVHSVRSPDGTTNLIGKVVVDMRTGNVYGFPTGTKAPYPIDSTQTEPPVSRPILLGKFDFARIPGR